MKETDEKLASIIHQLTASID